MVARLWSRLGPFILDGFFGGAPAGWQAAFDSESGIRAALVQDYAGIEGGQFFANGDNTLVFDDLHTFDRASLARQKDTAGDVVFSPHNLIKDSQNLANATNWRITNGSAVSGAADPDGGTDAVTFTEDTANDVHHILAEIVNRLIPRTVHIFHTEVFLSKAQTRRYVTFATQLGAPLVLTFDTQTGTITDVYDGGIGTVLDSGVEDLGTYYRLWYEFRADSGSSLTMLLAGATTETHTTNAETYVGDGVSTMIAWGMSPYRIPMAPALDTFAPTYVPSTAALGFQHRLDHNVSGARLGLLREKTAAETLCLHGSQLTRVDWNTVTNITPLFDQTGADGDANSASSLLATAGNAIITQAITSSSATRVFSALVKRLVGTGNIEMTQDGGSSWTDVTSQINSSTYTQVGIAAATVTNPVVGFRIVTSGDKIAVQFCDSVVGTHITSPMGADFVALTRAAETITTAVSDWAFSATAGSLYGVVTPNHTPNATTGELILFSLNDDTTNEVIEAYVDTSANVRFRVTDGGVDQCDIDSGVNAVGGTELKIAVSWILNGFAISVNGQTVQVDTGGTIPTVTQLEPCENGLIASLAAYSSAFVGADLLARTA